MQPYLLLDIRDSEQFESSRIITAESYPKTMLSRANYETPSLLKYVIIRLFLWSIQYPVK